MPKLLCIGDSITYGAWDTQGGWDSRVRKRIDQECLQSKLKKFYLTYNLGISSDTSEQLLQRFDADVASHMHEEGELMFVFSIGTNDSTRNAKDNKLWVEPKDFENNVRKLLQKAKRHSDKMLFLGNMPVDESKTQPYVFDPTITSSNEDIQAYEKIAMEVCRKENVDCLPVFSQVAAIDYQKLLIFDGLHPNDDGHALLADLVWKHIEEKKWL
ncbi:MAG: GDSL-type esterase/lipase family protein [Patescibacteria group bacterium]|nr:GDSL-type esterase/lipase family protein [Patescibacteria group bacterium]